MHNQWPIIRLGELLQERRERPALSAILDGTLPIVAKIGFDKGEIELRNEAKTKTDMILIHPGDLVISGINVAKGAVAVYSPPIDKPAVATIHYSSYSIDKEKADSMYIWHFLRSDHFKRILFRSFSKGIKTEVKPAKFLDLEIPLPCLEKQRAIVMKIQSTLDMIETITRLRAPARHYQLGEAVIKSTSEADIIMRAIRNKIFTIENPIGPIVSIEKSGLMVNKETTNPRIANPTEDFLYLDISGVEGVTGRILELKKYKGCDAPSRARRVMRTRDVIISTVRPYLRSFTIVPADLDNQICSTGFAIFTCPPEIDHSFLLHQFFSDFFVEQCIQKMQGGHYPAINVSKLRTCQIFVPSKEKQQTITAFLASLQAKANELRKLQMETEREIEQLLPKILNKAFQGDL